MWKELKAFIMRGNVIDLAVGVIIGGAFGKIVASLVNDILMPFIGLILGGVNFSGLAWKIKDASINYGMFLQSGVDFLIIATAIFFIVKAINRLQKKPEAAPAPAEPTTKECPYCLSTIPIKATRCPHCTSQLN
jgi:large conductance mechanosensitive channel